VRGESVTLGATLQRAERDAGRGDVLPVARRFFKNPLAEYAVAESPKAFGIGVPPA
jgi:hypothetical protein